MSPSENDPGLGVPSLNPARLQTMKWFCTTKVDGNDYLSMITLVCNCTKPGCIHDSQIIEDDIYREEVTSLIFQTLDRLVFLKEKIWPIQVKFLAAEKAIAELKQERKALLERNESHEVIASKDGQIRGEEQKRDDLKSELDPLKAEHKSIARRLYQINEAHMQLKDGKKLFLGASTAVDGFRCDEVPFDQFYQAVIDSGEELAYSLFLPRKREEMPVRYLRIFDGELSNLRFADENGYRLEIESICATCAIECKVHPDLDFKGLMNHLDRLVYVAYYRFQNLQTGEWMSKKKARHRGPLDKILDMLVFDVGILRLMYDEPSDEFDTRLVGDYPPADAAYLIPG